MQSPSSDSARDRDSDSDSETDVEEPIPSASFGVDDSGEEDNTALCYNDDDTGQEITQICKRGSHWEYRTDRTVGDSFERCRRVPPGLDESWAKWAREHPGTWGPPPLALNGISKCSNGTIKIYWADLGDTSDVHAKRRGPNVQTVASLEELQKEIPGLIAEQIEQIQKAPVMQFITDAVGNLGSDTADLSTVGFASCLRVRVEPFGSQKSQELTSDTVGCACVAVLMAMPEGCECE